MSFKVTPNPMTLAATNQAQVFVSDSVSSSLLQCQTGVFGSPTAASSSDPNDLDADGLTSGDAFCQGFTSIVPTSTVVNVAANKAVKGDLDPGFRKFPAIGAITSAGGAGKFQLNLTNVGGVALRDLVIYDILPFVGDTGLSQTQLATPRGSDWATTFVGLDPTTVPAGAVVEYSASTNPCRNELTTPAGAFPAGCVNDWSTMLPSGSASLVRALRVTFPAGTLSTFDPTEQIAIEYDVTYPAGVTPGTVAWNNFAYAATRTDTGTAILPAEPPKVGLAIPQVDLALTKAVAPATVLVGQPVTYTVTIDHQGSVSPSGVYTLPAGVARNVELRDDLGGGALTVVGASSLIINERTGSSDGATFDESTGAILIPELGPNDKYVLTYQARRSTSGATTNLAEVLDHPGVTDIDSTPGNGVPTEDDIATATAQWVAPSIDLQKQVESSSGSGSFIEADASDGLAGRYQRYQPVRYRFVVTNTSAIPLTGVTLTDSVIWFACDRSIGNMAPGQIVTIDCTWPFGFASGRVVNTATVNGVATVSGATSTVSDTDLATVEIQAPIDLSLTKRVDVSGNGNWVSSASVSLGSTFKYQLTVSNSPTAGEATGVVVREELPAGVTVVSGPAEFDLATSQWSVGTLAAGASKSIELVARIADLAQFRAGTGINRAQVSAANEPDIDSVPGNGVTTEDDIDHADITVNVHAIGNQVFEDLDANGVRDSNEVGIAGVTMELLNSSGVVIASSTTDSGGMYLFDDLPSGRYRVRVAAAEFLAGGTLQGWKSDLVEEALADSDIDNNDNGLAVLGEIVSGEITLDSSEPTNESPTSVSIAADSYSNLTVDFGFYRLGSIGDFVWLDTNADGVQQSTETGIAGVRVVLLDAAGATIASAETGSDGRYLFSDLVPGSYQVKFDLTSLPIELRATVDNTSDDAADSDANPLTGLTALVRLAGGQDIRTVDLGATKAVHELVLTKVALGNAVAGQNVDWKIVLKNNGPDPARGAITLTDALPAELSFVSAASQTDGLSCDYATATRTVSCVTANGLGSGKELVALVTTTVSPSAGASIVNSASVATQTQTQIAPASEKVDVRGASLSNPAVPVPSTPARESTAAGSLVLTGANSTLWAGLAVAILCLGCVFAALSRRREPKH